MLDGEKTRVHHVIFEAIDEEAVKKAVLRTKGGSGPSGMDADNWKRILTSNALVQQIKICEKHQLTALRRYVATIMVRDHSLEAF